MYIGLKNSSSGSSTTPTTPASQAVNSSVVTVSGTVAAGATSVMFQCSSDFAGTINGVARDGDFTRSYTAKEADLLPAIAYTITAGSITIDKII